jgi:hypothetical protein
MTAVVKCVVAAKFQRKKRSRALALCAMFMLMSFDSCGCLTLLVLLRCCVQHDAIPVDTHVWDLATRYYAPQLAKKTLNKQLHADIQQVFVQRFGPYAGWAHNTLFISELASHRHLLPAGLAAAAAASGSSKGKDTASKKSSTGAAGRKRSADVAGKVAGLEEQGVVADVAAAAATLAAGARTSRSRRRPKRCAGGSSDAADSDVASE